MWEKEKTSSIPRYEDQSVGEAYNAQKSSQKPLGMFDNKEDTRLILDVVPRYFEFTGLEPR